MKFGRMISVSVRRVREAILFYYRGLVAQLSDHDIFLYASGIAFNGLVCLIPALLLLTSVLAVFLDSSSAAMKQVNDLFAELFPGSLYTDRLRQRVLSLVNDVVFHRRSLGFIGTITLTWTMTGLLSALRTVLNSIYHSSRRLKFFLSQLYDWGTGILIGVFFVVMNLLTWLVSFSMKSGLFSLKRGSVEYFLLNPAGGIAAGFFIAVISFWFIYRFIPSEKQPGKVLLVSSVTTGLLWETAGHLFSYFLTTYRPYRTVYGAYTVIIAAIFWVYYTGIIFVIGAIAGQLYKERSVRGR